MGALRNFGGAAADVLYVRHQFIGPKREFLKLDPIWNKTYKKTEVSALQYSFAKLVIAELAATVIACYCRQEKCPLEVENKSLNHALWVFQEALRPLVC